MSVNPSPMAIGANPAGARLSVRQNDHQEEEGQHDFSDQARPGEYPAGECSPYPLAANPPCSEKPLSRGDQVQHRCARDRSQGPERDIRAQFRGLETFANHEPSETAGFR